MRNMVILTGMSDRGHSRGRSVIRGGKAREAPPPVVGKTPYPTSRVWNAMTPSDRKTAMWQSAYAAIMKAWKNGIAWF